MLFISAALFLFKEMLPCISFNVLHHYFSYETERSATLYKYRKLSDLEQIHLTYLAHFFKLWPVVVTKLGKCEK